MHVPYKGGGQAVNDVIAGHVPMAMTSIQVAAGWWKADKLKGLAVTSKKRAAVLPNVPTIPEAGVTTDDVALGFWFGIFGPGGHSGAGESQTGAVPYRKVLQSGRARAPGQARDRT